MDSKLKPTCQPFAGRLGANQAFIVDRYDPANTPVLQHTPDAAPLIPLPQLLDLRGFRAVTLWKQAMAEGLGTFILVYITDYMAISPNVPPPAVTSSMGPFGTASFAGSIVGALISTVILTVAIYGFGPITGGHLNPFITIATLFVRLTSLPRAVLYVLFQIAGATLAGLMIRASWGSRDFKVGGCFLFETEGATVASAFAMEFTVGLAMLFLVFGVAFDPRNAKSLGPTLAPFLVGCIIGTLSLGFGFPKAGFGGVSMNPTRCFGAYVGSSFPHWHWVHWIGPVLASATHSIMYAAIPPWQLQERKDIEMIGVRASL